MRAHRKLIALLAALTLVLVAGCGSDDDTQATTPAPSPTEQSAPADTTAPADSTVPDTSAPASTDQSNDSEPETIAPPATEAPTPATGEPLLLGMALDSAQHDIPEVQAGADAAAKAINDAGGVGGRPIEIRSCDMKGDPNQSVDCVTDLADDGAVAFIYCDGIHADAASTVLDNRGIPLIGGGLATSQFTSNSVFPVTITAFGGLAAEGHLAIGPAGGNKVAIAGIQAGPLAALISEPIEAGGGEIVATVDIPVAAPDMTPYVAAATANDADTIVLNLAPSDFPNFIRTLRASGEDATVVTNTNALYSVLNDTDIEDLEGVYAAGTFIPAEATDDPRTARFNAEMDAIGAETRGDPQQSAWASTHVFAAVAADLPEVTSESLLATLPTFTGIDLGIVQAVPFTEKWTAEMLGGVQVNVYNPYAFYVQVKDGAITPLSEDFERVL